MDLCNVVVGRVFFVKDVGYVGFFVGVWFSKC